MNMTQVAPKPNAGSVVIVDDDHNFRGAVKRYLQDHGYSVVDYASSEELKNSLRIWGEPANSCLLMDMRLEGKSGLETFNEIRLNGFDMPVIFISGQAEVPEVISSLKGGAIDFLLKPVDPKILISTVTKALQSRSLLKADSNSEFGRNERFNSLTPREKEVMQYILRGLKSQKIADLMGITLRTVKMHRTNIMLKVGADGVSHLLAIYHQSVPETNGTALQN
jgi:FixJ family two-component response regulator